MGLTDVFTAVNNDIIAQGQTPSAAAATSNAYFGEEFLTQETGWNKYVWVPAAEGGAGPTRGPNTGIAQTGTPRSLFGRICPVDIHCWGADGGTGGDPIVPYQQCELLFQQLSQSVQRVLTPRSFRYVGGQFEQGPQTNRAGRVFVARFEFHLQVADVTQGTAVVRTVQLTGTI